MHGSARTLLCNGRQPGQFERQPRMGIRPRREHRRQGVLHLAESERAGAVRAVPLKGGGDRTMRETTMRKGQCGVTVMGLLLVLVLFIVVALFAMKVLPSFMEFRTAKAAIEAVARQGAASAGDARRAFDNRATIDNI